MTQTHNNVSKVAFVLIILLLLLCNVTLGDNYAEETAWYLNQNVTLDVCKPISSTSFDSFVVNGTPGGYTELGKESALHITQGCLTLSFPAREEYNQTIITFYFTDSSNNKTYLLFIQGTLTKPENFQWKMNMTHITLMWNEPPSRIKGNVTYILDLIGSSYQESVRISERIYSLLRPPVNVTVTVTPYNSVGAGENSTLKLYSSCENDEIMVVSHVYKKDDAILITVHLTLKENGSYCLPKKIDVFNNDKMEGSYHLVFSGSGHPFFTMEAGPVKRHFMNVLHLYNSRKTIYYATFLVQDVTVTDDGVMQCHFMDGTDHSTCYALIHDKESFSGSDRYNLSQLLPSGNFTLRVYDSEDDDMDTPAVTRNITIICESEFKDHEAGREWGIMAIFILLLPVVLGGIILVVWRWRKRHRKNPNHDNNAKREEQHKKSPVTTLPVEESEREPQRLWHPIENDDGDLELGKARRRMGYVANQRGMELGDLVSSCSRWLYYLDDGNKENKEEAAKNEIATKTLPTDVESKDAESYDPKHVEETIEGVEQPSLYQQPIPVADGKN